MKRKHLTRLRICFGLQFVSPGTPTGDEDRPNTPDPLLLNVKKSPTSSKTKMKRKEKNKTGEMPDWMVNFVTSKNLTVGEDVKLDETKLPNS